MNTKQLKSKILDLAIHGKLVPQNPNDEPASKLLEKIREEKQKLMEEENMLNDIDITSLSNKVNSDETKAEDTTDSVDIKNIFSSFGV